MEEVNLTESNYEAPTVARKTVLQTIGRCCDVCGFTAESFDHYWKHIEQHVPVCHLCNQSFRTLNCLVKHKQSDHNELTSYLCGVCGKRFSDMWAATSHFSICRNGTVIYRNKKADCSNEVYSVKNNNTLTAEERLPNNFLLTKVVGTSSSNGSTLAVGRNNLEANSSFGYNIVKIGEVSNSTHNSNTSIGFTSVLIIPSNQNVINSFTDFSTTAASSDKNFTKVSSELINLNNQSVIKSSTEYFTTTVSSDKKFTKAASEVMNLNSQNVINTTTESSTTAVSSDNKFTKVASEEINLKINNVVSLTTNSVVRNSDVEKNKEILYCKTCKKVFLTNLELHNHYINRGISNPVECKICKQVYKNDCKLNTHMVLHYKKLLTKCNICDKWVNVNSNHNKKKHKQRVAVNLKDTTCNICGKMFVTKAVLKRHKRYKHVINQVACEICNKICKNEFMLKLHLKHAKTHNNKSVCEICGKVVSGIVPHLKIHDDERRIEAICEICGKGFNSYTGFTVHMEGSHTEGRYHVCIICNASFKTSVSLKNHIKRHLEATLECNLCQRKFNDKNHLKIHLRIHTGEEPYSCRNCGESFKWLSSLSHHKKKCTTFIRD